MSTIQLLAQTIGVFMTIVGLSFLFRRKYFLAKLKVFFTRHTLRIIFACGELLTGLFLVLTLSQNFSDYPLYGKLIIIIGWSMVAEGVLNLIVSEVAIEKAYRSSLTEGWLIGFSLVFTLLGVYFAGAGFGFF